MRREPLDRRPPPRSRPGGGDELDERRAASLYGLRAHRAAVAAARGSSRRRAWHRGCADFSVDLWVDLWVRLPRWRPRAGLRRARTVVVLRRGALRRRLLRRGASRLGFGRLLGVAASTGGSAAPRTGERSMNTQPTCGHRLAADQAALVEQPAVLPVELLEGVVREHRRRRHGRDLQQERVAAPDHTRGRRR